MPTVDREGLRGALAAAKALQDALRTVEGFAYSFDQRTVFLTIASGQDLDAPLQLMRRCQALGNAPDLSALLAQADTAERMEAERDEARADQKAAEDSNDALNVKLHALAPHGSCACSYDKPGDVCAHHSPALSAALAEVARLSAEVETREQENAVLREIVNAGLAETAFAVADERDGSATDRTRRVRFAGIRDALRGVGDPRRVAALTRTALAAGQDKTEGGA